MSTLKVNSIEKYSGSSGVTIKDTVNIAPDSGVKNLVVSGNTTVESNLTVNGTADFDSNITMDNTNISGTNQISCASIQVSGAATAGSLVVGGTTLLNPWKMMGKVTLTNNYTSAPTLSGRIAEFNVETLSTSWSGTFSGTQRHSLSIFFDTDMSNTNYLVFLRPEGTESGNAYLVSQHTDKIVLEVRTATNGSATIDYMVISP